MEADIQVRVSQSPPRETARRRQDSRSELSRKATTAGGLEMVGGTDFVAGLGEVVGVAGFNVLLDFGFGFSGASEEDGGGGGLGPFYAFGVVVGDGGLDFGDTLGLFERVEHPADGAGAHGGAVAPAVVGLADFVDDVLLGAVGLEDGFHLGRGVEEPVVEAAAVAAHGAGIFVGEMYKGANQRVGIMRRVVEEPVGDGESHDAVVGKVGKGGKEREFGGFDVAEFVNRAYGVSNDSA